MTTLVEKSKTLDEGIKNIISSAIEDFTRWSTDADGTISSYSQRRIDAGLGFKVNDGSKYIKLTTEMGNGQTCVWGFVVKSDNDKKFRQGDVLLAAGFNKPARNKARGNIFDGNFKVTWSQPLYL